MIHFIELCAGSAALSMAIENAPIVVSYAGSKKGYAKELLEIMNVEKMQVKNITIVEPGVWGAIHRAFSQHKGSEIAMEIEKLAMEEPRSLFNRLIPSVIMQSEKDMVIKAAELLCRLASTYGGKEIGGFKGSHKHRPSVDGFIPSRMSLASRCRAITMMKKWEIISTSALNINEITSDCERTIVYIDPPYMSTSGQYMNHLSREDVITLARKWTALGADVYVSENEAIPQLLEEGWESKQLKERYGQTRKGSKIVNEWVTFKTTR